MTTVKLDNPIFAISARADELRAEGRDIIVLAAGEPDAPTPSNIVDAARRAIDDPELHHYGEASGLTALRQVVARDVFAKTGTTWSASDVLVTLGTKHALHLALGSVAHDGGEVLIAHPGWPGHRGAAIAAGATPVDVGVDADHNFLVTVDSLERSWTPRSRAVILASPANPTGSVYSREALSAIATWALTRDVWLIVDDIYDAFVYEGTHASMLEAAPEARERTISVNGVSKAYAMTGWRVGWLLGPPDIVSTATRHVSRTITHVPLITQIAALEAISSDPSDLAQTARRYRARRDRTVEALRAIVGVDCPLPDGGMYVFPSVRELLAENRSGITTSAELASWLLEEVGVAVVPGEAFGAPGRLRMCFAVGDVALTAALGRLTTALTAV
ncbi:aminotransferase class I/II-fold pyridoxal phosphate-dependent enzyme [Rhodococcus sp. B10]|uniref:aminotransferase class I/II-fold pyridoxal phosphate-dependent enzyme n=1 Tax=Rhodococcus sp. B10 TaxID=2695876 RepID=UPI001430592F|nr:aminotransferase class I/II-fold pyridoxal phosphate-dependent enzyme [Rhodococcus sp. B10]NIL77877.1 Aspartate aminotransferase [Rhodococcus sp. B10]